MKLHTPPGIRPLDSPKIRTRTPPSYTTMSAPHRVFVYGTLKKGQPNHHFMHSENDALFLSNARTLKAYPLIIATHANIPMMLNTEGGHRIYGELYDVDDAMLEKLDELELVNVNYHKETIQVQKVDGPDRESYTECTAVEEASCYIVRDFKPEILNETMYDNYDAHGCHGKKYVMPADRDHSGPPPFSEIKLHYDVSNYTVASG